MSMLGLFDRGKVSSPLPAEFGDKNAHFLVRQRIQKQYNNVSNNHADVQHNPEYQTD
jgi:hypothetical protein